MNLDEEIQIRLKKESQYVNCAFYRMEYKRKNYKWYDTWQCLKTYQGNYDLNKKEWILRCYDDIYQVKDENDMNKLLGRLKNQFKTYGDVISVENKRRNEQIQYYDEHFKGRYKYSEDVYDKFPDIINA